MKKINRFVIMISMLGIITAGNAATSMPPKPSLLNQSKQILVVTTDSWDTYQGYLQPYERSGPNNAWQPVGNGWPVVVGKKGLGWGANYKTYSVSGPIKQEGDTKAPAGVFTIGSAFGFSPTADQQLKLSYIPITKNTFCVDDNNSKYYGKVIDTSKVPAKDWNSGEVMIEANPSYIKGLVVNYNIKGNMPKGGSCIFMHIMGPSSTDGTEGCTAMEKSNVSWLLNWLDPKANPLLVQLPKEQYLAVQKTWGLPAYQNRNRESMSITPAQAETQQ